MRPFGKDLNGGTRALGRANFRHLLYEVRGKLQIQYFAAQMTTHDGA
jgi:hypothetical protein